MRGDLLLIERFGDFEGRLLRRRDGAMYDLLSLGVVLVLGFFSMSFPRDMTKLPPQATDVIDFFYKLSI